MENENHQEQQNRDGGEALEIIETAFQFLMTEAPKSTARAITGVGLALLAIADQMSQGNFIRSAEVFGFVNLNDDGSDEQDELDNGEEGL